jgi:isoleucyl-tRNA synthetase
LKQQAELYRRIRNTLRWLLGSLAGFTDAERVARDDMPELERLMLHRLAALDARVRGAAESYDWAGVMPDLHGFCASDLSAFYFDIRKDSLYCDAPSSRRRRAARTVLDHVHRCLCTWLAPTLVFTADEAWTARFGEETSVHLEQFPTIPAAWWDDALAEKWDKVRDIRGAMTAALEEGRRQKLFGSSLQAHIDLPLNDWARDFLTEEQWAELAIVSSLAVSEEEVGAPRPIAIGLAPGEKCARCWRVLPEVGNGPSGAPLCRRCEAAIAA